MNAVHHNELIEKLASDIKQLVNEDIGPSFGGPSVFFHLDAIKLCRSDKFLSEDHIKSIYAGLCAWGMHRMGDTDTKLVEYDKFLLSILEERACFERFRNVKINCLSYNEFRDILDDLTTLVFSPSISVSSVKLVANTKTIAHILPDLVPFIDRRYTLHFITGKAIGKGISVSETNERAYFKEVMEILYLFSHDKRIVPYLKLHAFPMATSIPKIFDNCLISFQK